MSALLKRTNAIIALTPAANYLAKTGYLGTFSGNTFTVSSSATVKATGVILEPNTTAAGYASELVTVGLLGSVNGTVGMALGGTVTKGAFVQQSTDGTVVTDAGTGARVLVGVALESGIAGDIIEVAPFGPEVLS